MRCESKAFFFAANSICFIAVYSAMALARVNADELGLSTPPPSAEAKRAGRQSRRELRAELKSIRAQLDRIERLLVQQVQRPEPTRTIIEEPQSPEPIPARIVDGLRIHHDPPIAQLDDGKIVPLGNGQHIFIDVPEFVKGRKYTARDGYQGNLIFDVLEGQTVFVALYGKDWGGGGNPSGNWQHEVVSREQLEQQGWKQVGSLAVKHSNPEYQDEPPWLLYSRACKAGESFLIRNHKYQAPVLIWSSPTGSVEVD